mgnify:FL=1
MVDDMKPGSVVVDLAAEAGGNIETIVPGKNVHIFERYTFSLGKIFKVQCLWYHFFALVYTFLKLWDLYT